MQSITGTIEALGNSTIEHGRTDYSVIRLRTGKNRNRTTVIEDARVFRRADTALGIGNTVTLHHDRCIRRRDGASEHYQLVFAVTEDGETLDDIDEIATVAAGLKVSGIVVALISVPFMLLIFGFFMFLNAMGDLQQGGSIPSKDRMRSYLDGLPATAEG